MKSVLLALVFTICGFTVHAELMPITSEQSILQATIKAALPPADPETMINWKVGDTAEYKIKGGLVRGEMKMQVREETSGGFWVNQIADLGFMGEKNIDILYDKTTGAILEVIVDGEKKDAPSPDAVEIIETRSETINVPKGRFDCTYTKMKDKETSEISEAWLTISVPINGLVKAKSPSPVGDVTLELTNFIKL